MLTLLRWVGYAEGLSFLVLLGYAMPLKYFGNDPSAVTLFGRAHGALFCVYVLVAWIVARAQQWPLERLGQAFLAAVLPFGPFVFERRLARELEAEGRPTAR